MSTKQDESTAFDPSRRKLCPDGSCIGLIGSDGKCTVCGRLGASGSGETPAAGPPALPTPEPEREIDGEAGSEATSSAIASNAEEGFDPNRRLCPDDACIGVIGSDNKCSVCGRRG
jgi:hypothetical protein